MMTEVQRYWFDLNGYLHLKNVLTEEEVAAASEAARRYVEADEADLPEGFEKDGRRHVHGFAFDKALERLALHPTTWPLIKEVTNGRPRLGSGTLQVNIPRARDDVSLSTLGILRYIWEIPGEGNALWRHRSTGERLVKRLSI
jgi:hypothetical protein